MSSPLFAEAEAAFNAQRFDEVGRRCQAILAAEPNHAGALRLMGIAAARTGRLDLARRALDHALRLEPDRFEVASWLGAVLQRLGEFDEARAVFSRCVELDPGSWTSYLGIFRGQRMTSSDRPLVDRAIALLPSLESEDDRRQLAYGIAKSLDDLGDYALAAEYCEGANRLAAALQKPVGMDRELYGRRIRRMSSGITPRRLQEFSHLGSGDRRPIFIVGMIRSGTTLVEQIVSAHPQVAAGDELRFWVEKGPAVVSEAFNADLAADLAMEYRALLERIGRGRPRVTDKMPLNYMLLGLLHLLFPEAPIIHCKRNPADTCVSIYMTPFAAPPPDFAYDRGDIEFAYREYRKAMDYWKSILPEGRIYEVEYEELTSQPEPAIRDLVAHCGLPWDDGCLRPQENPRAVDTPSRWQVRQPIYTRSGGRSSHYPQWFSGLRDNG